MPKGASPHDPIDLALRGKWPEILEKINNDHPFSKPILEELLALVTLASDKKKTANITPELPRKYHRRLKNLRAIPLDILNQLQEIKGR